MVAGCPQKVTRPVWLTGLWRRRAKDGGSCSFRFKVFLRHLAHKIKAKNMNTIATAFYYFQALKE